jgi:hypothetical protein
MKSTNRRLLFPVILLSLGLAQLSHGQSSVTVRDFLVEPFGYGYEGWKDLNTVQTKTAKGVEIKGPSKGGAGLVLKEVVNISAAKQLEVKIKRGPGNTAEAIFLKLSSGNGKAATMWNIPLKDVSDTEFTTITLDLAKARVKGGVNLEEVKNLQIQGNFNPTTQIDIEIASITATGTAPAPAPAGAPAPAATPVPPPAK